MATITAPISAAVSSSATISSGSTYRPISACQYLHHCHTAAQAHSCGKPGQHSAAPPTPAPQTPPPQSPAQQATCRLKIRRLSASPNRASAESQTPPESQPRRHRPESARTPRTAHRVAGTTSARPANATVSASAQCTRFFSSTAASAASHRQRRINIQKTNRSSSCSRH